MSKILVTGTAGFVGAAVTLRLLSLGHHVTGIDNLNDYYDPLLKHARLSQFQDHPNFTFTHLDIADRNGMTNLFDNTAFDAVIHLAAQAGVRYSIDNPMAYIDSNVVGTMTVLEGCRHSGVQHLLYATSSSVYGNNTKMPFSTDDRVDTPISLYAATKKSNELMAYTYAHLYQLPVTGLRFFTVYGPWGRPDMAPMKFAKAIYSGQAIDVYNHGDMQRDFTYIDDIVEGVIQVLDKPPASTEQSPPYQLFNIGNGQPVHLMKFIECLEDAIGKKAIKNLMPMQPGDVPATWADTSALFKLTGYSPNTSVEQGVNAFIAWYKEYYKC
ncbi:NAD-dependent epimerase [Nitrincola nitratireducens]|uniref:UDP-glucose 4-epimerase n=1 Tax=Nitrincola nitratireducens TaxID=1229521 RepID=W9V3U0_9GAMM|nr:NAD-dependent epimerase [Nitrincola nitratireducens]EXJ10797.1 UDP-glucose 4-epimerase [Nitrincola nitratireducens]